VQRLLRLAERADAADIPDGMSIPTELERRELRLAAIAEAKIEARAQERLARKLSPLVFVRPGDLRNAERGHFDLEQAECRIPPHLMKIKVQHIVPLSLQAVEVVREILAIPVESRFSFPALGRPERPMTENTRIVKTLIFYRACAKAPV
jgi:integrase